MITDTLMATGSWSLRLKDETPQIVLDALDWTRVTAVGFGHLFVFPARVNAPALSTTQLLKSSRWTGVLLEWSDARTIAGAGPAWWLGDASSVGDIISSPIARTAGTLTQWVSDLRPASLNAGTVTDPGGTATGSYQWVTRREALEAIADSFGVEWQVTPALALNVGISTALWASDPTVLVLPRFEGRDGTYRGLDALGVKRAQDLREYANAAHVLGPSTVTTATGASGFLDINGNAVTRGVVVNASSAVPGSESTVATNERTLRSSTRRHVVLSSDSHDIAGDVQPGAYAYVFDPLLNLIDTANQIRFAGTVVYPLKMRVMSQTWPIRQGYGVWFRDGNGTLTDLTDWFVPEEGAGTIEFGSIQRTLSNMTGLVGTQDSGKLANQVSYTAWMSYTPTVDQGASTNIAKTVNTARWRREGNTMFVEIDLTVTAAGTAGSDISVTVPTAFAHSNRGCKGSGSIYDASAAIRYPGNLEAATTTKVVVGNTGASYVGTTPSFALANGDVIRMAVVAEIA